MSHLSRRALMGTAGAIGAGAAFGDPAVAASLRAPAAPGSAPAFDTTAARGVLRRLLGDHAEQFRLTALRRAAGGAERFRVSAAERRPTTPDGGHPARVEVAGTSGAVILTGVHWYLKYVCQAHISWAGSQLRLPHRLPAPDQPIERSTELPHRFALNDTHDGYTAPYASWSHWERLIDVLALHGCNEVLVTVGQEAVYHRLLRDFGYSDAQARHWIPAPSHQPWWLLQNLSEYGGPVSRALLARRAELGRRIADRLRSLGMSPVFPGYFGTVPDDFEEHNPDAHTVVQGTWNGLPRPAWLDPRTDVFERVAAAFYRHQRDLFGSTGLYKMDLLHEGGDPGDVPVPDAARAVQSALRTARPDAVWVILGWQDNPRPELLEGVDRDRLLIVDGRSDLDATVDREQDWGGTPYAFGSIPNFGGRTTLGAKTDQWAERFTAWRDKAGSKLVGTAYMPEGAERDPAAFELFSELAWRADAVDRARWFADYADLRYGGRDRDARAAFAALRDTAYRIDSADGRPHDSVFAARPSLTARSGTHFATHTPAFDSAGFDAALAALLSVPARLRNSDAYRYDLTDVARQALANRSWQLIPQLQEAFERADLATFKALARLWLKLMRLADETAGAHSGFLLGPWLREARQAGANASEAALLERTARTLVTCWADRATADGGQLANYANRDWHGLISDVHLPQWRRYLEELEDALAEDREPAVFDWYAAEEPWTRERGDYPLRPTTDAHRVASRVRETLAKAPYQAEVTVTADPPALPPDGSTQLAATFVNLNGLSATGRVDLTLTGLDADPADAVSLPGVAAGGHGTARWRVKAPAEPPRRPLRPLEYELTTEFGAHGADRVRTVRGGTLFVAGPLADELRTTSTNTAVFGQLADRFAIDGGGADLWKATAEFGAVYRENALTTGDSVSVTVTAQANTGPWARAGLMARNSLGTTGAAGFVNLSVTPGNGVVLSYDSDGDGALDTYQRTTGVTAPVTLRLTRGTDNSFTGAFSVDDGESWQTIGTVTVPGTATAQDAGLFMSASNGGSGARGTVEYRDWRTD